MLSTRNGAVSAWKSVTPTVSSEPTAIFPRSIRPGPDVGDGRAIVVNLLAPPSLAMLEMDRAAGEPVNGCDVLGEIWTLGLVWFAIESTIGCCSGRPPAFVPPLQPTAAHASAGATSQASGMARL